MILEIVFTGICALVQTKSGIAAVMPDAEHDPHHPHVTWMMVEKDLLPRGRFNYEDNDPNCVPRGAVLLPHGALKIAGTKVGTPKFSGPKTEKKEPSPADAHSIRWVAKAPDFLHTVPRLKTEYASAGASNVGLWFNVPAGRFTEHGVNGCVWEMRRPGSDEVLSSQALAQEVIWTAQISNRDVLDVTVGDVTYHLNVKNKRTVRITFGNTPVEDIFPAGGHLEAVDTHFDIYYDMFAGTQYENAANRPLPHRSQTNEKCKVPESKTCPPARPVKNAASEIGVRRIGGANCPPLLLFEPTLTP